MANVLVVAELLEGKARKTTLCAVTAAKQIAEGTGGSFDILSIGEGAGAAADELAGYGAGKVLKAEIAGGYTCEKYAATVAEAGKGYDVLVACASAYGKDLLPRAAAKLDAGVASDISAVNVGGGKLSYTRPMYAGNVSGTVEILSDKHVVTVRQSEFDAAEASGGASPAEDIAVQSDPAADKVEFLGVEVVKSERPDLGDADVVVSGGRALKSADNFTACDAGYVSPELQVGQTGKVVAPKLYIAIGISGAIQHLAGMKGSKTIVAINKDKEAPIAQVADYFLVADLFDAVPALTDAVKKL
jgi:electron transfer flavoprotein alpha subunit